MKVLSAIILVISGFVFAQEQWPGVKYAEVRAYAWPTKTRLDDEAEEVILKDMSLKDGVINKNGTKLSAEQTKRLLKAVTGKHESNLASKCHIPHNAFVFYDAEKKPVAFVEVCFTCTGTRIQPAGSAFPVDLAELATLFGELELPVGGYPDAETFLKFFRELEERARPETSPGNSNRSATERRASGLAIDGQPSVAGMKCTAHGEPIEKTETLGYLDPFVLEFKLKGDATGEWKIAAWFRRVTGEQLKASFARDDQRGSAYEIVDSAGKLVAPEYPTNSKAIAFHAEASNSQGNRAGLSKGIGGQAVPMIEAKSGTVKLYSSMHQRFSRSLIGTSKKDFMEYGPRYSIEQLEKLPAGIYQMRLPYTVALIKGEHVMAVKQGVVKLKMDLSEGKRAETVESFKGSGAPVMRFEE